MGDPGGVRCTRRDRAAVGGNLIFGVGSSLSSWIFAAPIPKGKIAIQLTIDERDLNKDYPAEFLLMGDAKLVLSQMIEEIQRELGKNQKGDDRTAKEVKSVKDKWLEEWMPKLTSEENPINPYRVIWDLQSVLENEEYIVTHDAGSPRDQMAPFWTAKKPNSYIGWGKSTHLGYSLPLALGPKSPAGKDRRQRDGGRRLRHERNGIGNGLPEQNRHFDDRVE